MKIKYQKSKVKLNFYNREQSSIGIIVILVVSLITLVVGLISSGFYFYLSRQPQKMPEITEKLVEMEFPTPTKFPTIPTKKELPKAEITPEEKPTATPTPKTKKVIPAPTQTPTSTPTSEISIRTPCLKSGVCVNEKILLIVQKEGGPFATYVNRWGEITVDNEVTKFYSQNVEKEADLLVVFTDLDTSFTRAQHAVSIKRNISGVNKVPIDQSSVYGTKDLQAFVAMLNVTDHLRKFEDFENNLIILAHEIGHHWLFYLDNPSLKLTERVAELSVHPWSCFQQGTEGYFDPMGGLDWKQLDKNSFVSPSFVSRATERFRFSPLSLYLMGLIPGGSVSQMYWIERLDGSEDCTTGGGGGGDEMMVNGTKREVTIEDIIKVYGERIPDFKNSQKEFKAQFVLVAKENSSLVQEDVNKLEEFIDKFVVYFNYSTFGKASVRVVPFK